jgi:hypothetical protein
MGRLASTEEYGTYRVRSGVPWSSPSSLTEDDSVDSHFTCITWVREGVIRPLIAYFDEEVYQKHGLTATIVLQAGY